MINTDISKRLTNMSVIAENMNVSEIPNNESAKNVADSFWNGPR